MRRGIFRPSPLGPPAIPSHSLLSIVTYTGCLHCFNVIRDSSLLSTDTLRLRRNADHGFTERSREVDDAKTRRGWNTVINSTRSSFHYFFFPLLSLLLAASSRAREGTTGGRRYNAAIATHEHEFFIKLTRPVDFFGRHLFFARDPVTRPTDDASDKKLVLRAHAPFKYSLFSSVSDGRVCSHVRF